jgi:hypothetical protein
MRLIRLIKSIGFYVADDPGDCRPWGVRIAPAEFDAAADGVGGRIVTTRKGLVNQHDSGRIKIVAVRKETAARERRA